MSAFVSNAQWLETQQAEFAARSGAAVAFWPEFRSALNELLEEKPAKDRIQTHSSDEDPYFLLLSAGLFDLKLACDPLGDVLFYAFTSSALKKLIPRDTAIFFHGQVNLARGYWGIMDGPGEGVPKVFVEDPQGVTHFPLANRFARWCVEQLLGGYTKISALEEAAAVAAKAREESAKKEARNASGHARE
jgi:hypothetical protein